MRARAILKFFKIAAIASPEAIAAIKFKTPKTKSIQPLKNKGSILKRKFPGVTDPEHEIFSRLKKKKKKKNEKSRPQSPKQAILTEIALSREKVELATTPKRAQQNPF